MYGVFNTTRNSSAPKYMQLLVFNLMFIYYFVFFQLNIMLIQWAVLKLDRATAILRQDNCIVPPLSIKILLGFGAVSFFVCVFFCITYNLYLLFIINSNFNINSGHWNIIQQIYYSMEGKCIKKQLRNSEISRAVSVSVKSSLTIDDPFTLCTQHQI